MIKRLSTINQAKNKKPSFSGTIKDSKSILKEIGSFTNDDISQRKEVIHHDTQLLGFKYKAKKNKTMNDFERSEQKRKFLANYTHYYQAKFKPNLDQYRYNLAKVITPKTFETAVASPVSNYTEPDQSTTSHLLNSPQSMKSQYNENTVLQDNKSAYIPVNKNIKMIINLPKDPLRKMGLDRSPVSPHPMVSDKRFQTMRTTNMKNKASTETLNDLGKVRPTVSSFRKADHSASLPKIHPMKTTIKPKVTRNDKDKLEFLDKFDEKPPAPFLTEGLGLLALHSMRHSKLTLTEDFKPENFKIPISTLSKRVIL